MTHWPILVEFAALSLTVGISGYFLSLYGNVIAEKTGMGGTWVGLAMIATVTSLPELVTGISAVTYVGVPDIATDDLAYLDGRPAPGQYFGDAPGDRPIGHHDDLHRHRRSALSSCHTFVQDRGLDQLVHVQYLHTQ